MQVGEADGSRAVAALAGRERDAGGRSWPLAESFVLVLCSSASTGWGKAPPELTPAGLPEATYWQALVPQVAHLLANASSTSEFGIVVYDGMVARRWQSALATNTSANADAAVAWLSAQATGYANNPFLGIQAALNLTGGPPQQLIIISDGMCVAGQSTPAGARGANPSGIRTDVVLYGKETSSSVMAEVATDTGGTVIRFP